MNPMPETPETTMRPEDVPDELVKPAAEVLLRDYESQYDASYLSWEEFADQAREIVVAVLPAHEAMVRAKVAEEIEHDFRENVNDVAINDHADTIITARCYGMYRAARIARGEQP